MNQIKKALETLPESLEEVTIEAVQETEEELLETQESVSVTLEAASVLEEFSNALGDAAPILAASGDRASGSASFTDNDLIYTVSFNGRSLRVLFPENMRDYLVVRDNYLLNLYGSSIVGLVLDSGDSAEMGTYHEQYLTLYPFTNTSGVTNAYRYGGYSYITTYSPYNGTQLTTSTEYGTTTVTQKPGLFQGFTSFQLCILFCAALIVLINVFGGIFRR